MYEYVVARSMMREPVSKRKLMVLDAVGPLTVGVVTLREKPRLVHTLVTPRTAPSVLKAASVPLRTAVPPIVIVATTLAVVSPTRIASAHDCSGDDARGGGGAVRGGG